MPSPIAYIAVIAPLSEAFVRAIEHFAKAEHLDLVVFEKDQLKDNVAKDYLAGCSLTDGVLFIGRAHEKVRVSRTKHKRNPRGRETLP